MLLLLLGNLRLLCRLQRLAMTRVGRWSQIAYNCCMTHPVRRVILRSIVILIALGSLALWWHLTPPGLWSKLEAIGYAVCHRLSERSFHIGERQLPLCARCSGMYLGAVVGLVYQFWRTPRRSAMPGKSVLALLGVLALIFAVDGANSYLMLAKTGYPVLERIRNLYTPHNTLRLLTGSGLGLGLAAIIFPTFNATVWAEADDRAAFPSLKSFLPLLGLTLLLDLLVLTENPFILYPLAIVSTSGVLILLTLVYSLVWAMITRQENVFHRWSQLWPVLLLGLTTAWLQIGAMDFFRFALTGTWGAFPLPAR